MPLNPVVAARVALYKQECLEQIAAYVKQAGGHLPPEVLERMPLGQLLEQLIPNSIYLYIDKKKDMGVTPIYGNTDTSE